MRQTIVEQSLPAAEDVWRNADLIVKVEEPHRGEPGRWGLSERADADSTYFIYYNLNKRSVTCNLKSDAGKALLARMTLEEKVGDPLYGDTAFRRTVSSTIDAVT